MTKLDNELALITQIVTHDLRDPLRQVLTNCASLEKSSYNSPTINSIIRNTELVLARIEYLKKYVQFDIDKESFADVDCNKVLIDAKNNLAVAIEKSGAKIIAAPLPVVWGNYRYLVQLFTYLLDNAIKFCGNAIPSIAISCSKESDKWLFKINDNGCGIDNVYKVLVFTLFQRLNPENDTNSQETSNLGIGLPFSKKIVEGHGGEIWFKSSENHGTVFYFSIPNC